MFIPSDSNTYKPSVGDEDEVSPTTWDCFQCGHSIDVGGPAGKTATCPSCGAEYEITTEARRVTRQFVKLTKCGTEESGLRLVINNPFGPGRIRI
jgi:predicted Zn finger-like uncharacterized protein